MFRLQHQFNNIVETTQLNNDQKPEFHCHCECSKCSLPAVPSCNTSQPPVILFEKSFTTLSIGPCGRLPQITWSASLSSALVRLWFKLAVSLQYCTPYVRVHWVYIRRIWRPLVFCDDIWTAGPQPVLCAARRCALCVLTRRPAGRWIRWAAGDCFKGTIIYDNL